MAKINVKDTKITILSVEDRDYISLTDTIKENHRSISPAKSKSMIKGGYSLPVPY